MHKKLISLLLALILIISCLYGCDFIKVSEDKNEDKKEEIKEKQNQEEVFNQGIVDYEVETVFSFDSSFDMNNLGKLVSKKTEGTTRVFFDTSDNKNLVKEANEVDCSSCAQSQIVLSYTLDNSSENGIELVCFANKSQTAFDGNGIKLSLNPKNKMILITTSNDSIAVRENKVENSETLKVICTYEKKIYVYIANDLVITLNVSDGKLYQYNGSGTKQNSCNIDEKTIGNEFYTVIVNEGAKMDKISMYKCGNKTETKNITATPVGNNKLGLDITDKEDLVGICYTMWFNAYLGNGDDEVVYNHNVSDLLEEYKFTSEKGFVNASGKTKNAENYYHYWGTPAQGYYRSTDKAAHRNSMNLLYKAGVDFIVCDYTFATYDGGFIPGTSAWKTYIGGPLTALLDTIMEMRAEGLGTPYVVLWPNSTRLFDALYENFVGLDKYKDCFVYWNEKPFILTWIYQNYTGDLFETRGMYGLQGKVTSNQWSYLEVDNKQTIAYDENGDPVHMTACVATQRTYMTNFETACGRDGGNFWYKQWKNVFDVHPKMMTITWWNEWGAILFHQNGQWFFTDNFNQEYSRDIEPMKDGHGDQYYKWLCEYVRAYKAHEECPKLTEY